MNKRGQFYLVAAIVIISILITLNAGQNYSRRAPIVNLEEVRDELRYEGKKVLDYAILNNLNKTKQLQNFTKTFDKHVGVNTDIYYLIGDSSNILAYNYVDNQESPLPYTDLGDDKIELEGFIDLETEVGTKYQFEMLPGENFHFIILREVGNNQYVITS